MLLHFRHSRHPWRSDAEADSGAQRSWPRAQREVRARKPRTFPAALGRGAALWAYLLSMSKEASFKEWGRAHFSALRSLESGPAPSLPHVAAKPRRTLIPFELRRPATPFGLGRQRNSRDRLRAGS